MNQKSSTTFLLVVAFVFANSNPHLSGSDNNKADTKNATASSVISKTDQAHLWNFQSIYGPVLEFQVAKIDNNQVYLAAPNKIHDINLFSEILTKNKLLGADPSVKKVGLISGGNLQARSFELKESVLLVETDSGEIRVPLEDVQSVVLKAKQGAEEQTALEKEPPTENDVILVQTSKGVRSVAGLIESLSSKSLSIDYKDKVRSIDLSKVIAIYPARVLDVGSSNVKPPKFRLQLIDRSVVYADNLSLNSDTWRISRKGERSELESAVVHKLSIESNRLKMLSDLPYKADPIDTLISEPQTTKRNLNVAGEPMRLHLPGPDGTQKEQTYSSGFGTHSTSRIAIDLPEGFNTLHGMVGIDVSAGKRGICKCVIRIDGTDIFSETLTGSGTAKKIMIDLKGKGSKLELIVLADQMMDLGDWVNWADMKVLISK